mgnify:CR=1 FL=1
MGSRLRLRQHARRAGGEGMIKLTDTEGRATYLAPDAIAQITEAGTASHWHGIRCYVKTFDGKTIEARETADEVLRLLAGALA